MADQEPPRRIAEKLATIRIAAQHEFPSGDIENLLSEVESGYLTCATSPLDTEPCQ
jgi:hypothetical protein